MLSEKFKVDRQLLTVKVFYFLIFAGIGCLMPYIPLFMRAKGFSQKIAGTVLGFTPFIAFIVQPVFGFIADKSNRHKLVLFICCMTSAFTFNALSFLPSSYTKFSLVETKLMINQSGPHFVDCYDFSVSSDLSCPLSIGRYVNQLLHINNASKNITRTRNVSAEDMTRSYRCSGTCYHNHILNTKENYTDNTLFFELKFKVDSDSLKEKSEFLFNDKSCFVINTASIIFDNNNNISFLTARKIVHNLTLHCRLQCSTVALCGISVRKAPSLIFKTLIILFLFLGYVSRAPVLNILDGIAFNLLGPERRYKYGRQRLWGTVSFALFALVTGYAMNNTNWQMTDRFRVSFHGYGIFLLILGFSLLPLKITQTKPTENDLMSMSFLFKDPKIILFLVVMAYLGCLNGTIEFFLFWFMEEELMNDNTLIPGLCSFSNGITEILMFFFSSKLLRRLGHLNCMYISIVAFAIRFGCYSIIQNAWFILPVELLNGLTFSLLWSAASSYGSSVVSESLSGTIQGIMHGIFFGLGKGLGGIITGQLYTLIGIRWVFRAAAIMTCVVFGLFFLSNFVLGKQSMSSPKAIVDEEFPVPAADTDYSKEKCLDKQLLPAE